MTSLLLLIFALYARAFDCSKAATAAERTVCSKPELQKLDQQLNETYKKALLTSADPVKLKSQQQAWMKQEQACANDTKCIETKYKQRLDELTVKAKPQPVPQVGQTLEFTYSYKKTDTNAKKLEDHEQSPVFSGTDKVRVDQANSFVKEKWGGDPNCADDPEGGVNTSIVSVDRIGAKAFSLAQSYSYYCAGGAYPSDGTRYFILVDGHAINETYGLTEQTFEKLAKYVGQISEKAAKGERKECAGTYGNENLGADQDHYIGFRKGYFIVRFEFNHATAFCDPEVNIPKSEFLSKFVPKGAVRTALESL